MSMVQALSVWMELEDALHGENGYGGDTAEIYIYRFMAYRPGAGYMPPEEAMKAPITGPAVAEDYDRANVLYGTSSGVRVRGPCHGWRVLVWVKRLASS